MKLKLFLCGLLFILSTQLVFSQAKLKVMQEPSGDFVYSVPSSWMVANIEGMKYQIARDIKKDSFAANINFFKENTKATFAQFFKIDMDDVRKNVRDYKEISNTNFSTEGGLKGKRLVCTNTQFGNNFMQVYYFLEGRNGDKFIITGTSLIKSQKEYLPIFDLIAKSFKLTK